MHSGDSFEAMAHQLYLTLNSKQVGMISINGAVVWYVVCVPFDSLA